MPGGHRLLPKAHRALRGSLVATSFAGRIPRVAQLCAMAGAFIDFVARPRRGCPQLDVWPDRHEVRGGGTGRKALHHPRHGVLRFEYATFQANDDPRLKLAIYAPARA